MIIDAGAAPACGSMGAAKVAQKSAAVETIRAGYDRYIITGGQAQNNVSVTQMPGQFQTSGTATLRTRLRHLQFDDDLCARPHHRRRQP